MDERKMQLLETMKHVAYNYDTRFNSRKDLEKHADLFGSFMQECGIDELMSLIEYCLDKETQSSMEI